VTTIPALLQANIDSQAATLGHLLRVTRTDGTVFGFTSAGDDVTIGGTLYSASQGLAISSIATSAGLAVDNLELTTIDDGTLFTRAQVLGGIWQNAAFALFRYNWASPSDGIEPLLAGTLGKVGLRDGSVVAELRGLQQYLQQTVGNVTTRTCRARFADYPTANGNNLCRLAVAAYKRTGTVSAVTSRQVFTAAALWTAVPTADYYGEGYFKWLTGANQYMATKVKTYVASGVITLMLPAVDNIVIGDTFEIVAGCRKRFTEDCKTKFSNALNFQGEPHLPGIDKLTALADASV
jgi:uncharacterized phage protein (TIGR02218 family)